MQLFHIKKSARRTTSSLMLASFIGATFSGPLMVNASEPDSTTHGTSKKMPMDHMSMDHKHMAMTGDADYDFAMMMRMHHENGVKMAQKELDKGKDPEMRAAAKKIVEAQTKEIAEFDKWLAAHCRKVDLNQKHFGCKGARLPQQHIIIPTTICGIAPT